MVPFFVQLIDYFYIGEVRLFLFFFVLTWVVFLYKLVRSRRFTPPPTKPNNYGVSVIVPVVDEDPGLWHQVLTSLIEGCMGMRYQIIVVSNGPNGVANGEYARKKGLEVIHLPVADKRTAIARGAEKARYGISVILDSDTIIQPDAIRILKETFTSPEIGGVTPYQKIMVRGNWIRRILDWREDLRFGILVSGQAINGAVSCLPGRLFAVRTYLLKAAAPELEHEYLFGFRCINGDDRTLTSYLLRNGYKATYQPASVVFTDAPGTFKGFVGQQLRWARGSSRAVIRDTPWLFRYPYTMFTVWSTVILRWVYLFVIFDVFLVKLGLLSRNHYLWQLYPEFHQPGFILAGFLVGYITSGIVRQLFHLVRHPQDWPYLPAFLVMSNLVLLPITIYADLTFMSGNWMTRKV